MASMKIFLFFYVIFGVILMVYSSDRCDQKSPCTCEYDDDRIIDLKPLSGGDFLTAEEHNLIYYFHPCTNKKLVFPASVNVSQGNNCSSTSLCLVNITAQTATNLGDIKLAKFVLNAGKYDIVYGLNKEQTIIKLVCTTDTENDLSYLHALPSEANQHNLILFSSKTCVHQIKHGLSTGSVLVILLLIFTILYFFGGAVVLHFLRGARGIEMVPNHEFWSDLPLLVKDGVVFLQNGCKPIESACDTYDRI